MQKVKNKSKVNSSKKINKNEGIFNYDLEVSDDPSVIEARKKLTKKAKVRKETEEDTIGINVPRASKDKVKQIQKKKKNENKKKQKELQRTEKEYTKVQKTKMKKKLTNEEIRKKRKRVKRIQNFSLFLILVIVIILLLLSPIFNIKEIEIHGNNKISTATILSLLSINENTNIFKETNKSITEKIKQNQYIDTVSITRELPSKLKINIKERNVDYMLEVGNSYAYIDNQGYILETSNEKAEGKVKLQGYETSVEHIIAGNRMCTNDLEKLKSITQIINSANNLDLTKLITSINIEDEDEYIIYMESEQKTIYLGNNSNLDVKMLYIQTILEKEKGNAGRIFVNRDLNVQKPFFSPNI